AGWQGAVPRARAGSRRRRVPRCRPSCASRRQACSGWRKQTDARQAAAGPEARNRRENTPWVRPSAELLEETQRSAALGRLAEVLQRLATARGIDRDSREQLAQLLGRPRIERGIGAAREPRNLPEGALGLGVATFLEHEYRSADDAELAGEPGQPVHVLLHAVADIDQRVHLARSSLALGMREHFADLREAARTGYLPHQPRQRVGIAHPFRGLALAVAAEIDELHVEPADGLDRLE